MPRHVDLPVALRGAAFRTAHARELGAGEGRLRGPDLGRPHHGVRTPATSAPDDLLDACAAYLPLLGAHHFSHLTAARLWGCPLPQSFDRRESLHVSAPYPGRAPRRPGVIGHQSREPRTSTRHGIPVSDAATTWISLAPLLPPEELVVCGDHLILSPHVLDPLDVRPHVSLEELGERLQNFTGRGARAAASAFRLLRPGAESRPETRLRLLLIGSRLPEPEVNVAVTDATGRWLGRGDLVYVRWRTVVEYDGDHHRTNEYQYDRDITRIDSFIAAGWNVVRVRRRGLSVARDETVARVIRALRTHGWQP